MGAEEPAIGASERLDGQGLRVWRAIAGLAAGHHGVVTWRQLVDCGLTRHQIDYATRARQLHRFHKGIFVVGHTALAPYAREYAAVLACGEGAVLSHVSAAHVYGLEPVPPQPEVTVVGRRIRDKPGVHVHCVAAIDRRDIEVRHGIPITSPARTLVDLAAVLDQERLELALNEARAQRLITEASLHVALNRAARRPGAGRLRRLLEAEAGPSITRSRAERLALRIIREARLPRPRTNVYVEGFLVDLYWPEHRLIVEIDGYHFHSDPEAFESDRARDAVLTAAGYRVIRITRRQVVEHPLRVATILAQALHRPRPLGSEPGHAGASDQRRRH